MTDTTKLEYRIIPHTRWTVTRYIEGENTGSCEERGIYDNEDIAYEVATALCKREHDGLGWPVGDERIKYPTRHVYDVLKADERPQDENMDGSSLSFETLEHGGEYPDEMPQAIRVKDDSGRWCIYLPTRENGRVVKSHAFGRIV